MASVPSTPSTPHHAPRGFLTPSAAARPLASELDTTMEDAEEEEEEEENHDHNGRAAVEDEFAFNAPTYYDLKHPEREQQYVNNADGYFYQSEQQHRQHQLDAAPPPPPATPARPTQSHNGRTPQTPFGMYREPQADHSEDSDTEMADDDRAAADDVPYNDYDDDRMSDGGRSDDTLVLDQLEVPSAPASTPSAVASSSSSSSSSLPPPPPRSLGHSQSGSALSSSLLQPTQAYLNRVQAEQAARERHNHEAAAAADHQTTHARPTHPRSPQLRTTQKAMQRQPSEPKLSSTSRELQKIQEEKVRVQMETLKVREYHERVRAQRVATNVHQRSTKQLTIPQSPYLEVGHRSTSRRVNHLNQSMTSSDDGSTGDHGLREEPHPYIPPEQLLSRDFEFPATLAKPHHNGGGAHDVTVPHTPQLRTSERAAARRNVFPGDGSPEPQPRTMDYSKMRVNGVTRPLSPQFETDRRAAQAASYRKPIEIKDKDAEELNRQFHARPVPKKIFQAPRTSPQKVTAARRELTRPVSPKLATSARARMSASHPMEDDNRHHQEKKALSSSLGPRRTGPIVPETPPLRSLQRHQMYQENLRRRQEAEEEELRKQREFKAQPLRVTTTPPKFEGSKKPLTEVQPFALRSDRLHERAQERFKSKRREEEEKQRAAAQFRAMPMPVPSTSDDESNARGVAPPRAPARALTKPSTPKFATGRRAAERAAFEAAERERRARDEEYKKQVEEEKRRKEEEEIKRLRREQLTFHARPVPVPKAFELKPTTRSLTEPESPFLQTKVRGGSTTTAA